MTRGPGERMGLNVGVFLLCSWDQLLGAGVYGRSIGNLCIQGEKGTLIFQVHPRAKELSCLIFKDFGFIRSYDDRLSSYAVYSHRSSYKNMAFRVKISID